MTKPVVLVLNDQFEELVEAVRQAHPDLSVEGCGTYEELAEAIERTNPEVVYSICFAGKSGFPRQLLVNSQTVKWISVGGSGTDHLTPWDAKRVTVTNSAGVAANMMAEYAIGALLHFSLNFPVFQQAQASREWVSGRVEPLEGKTVLIVGLGHTGQAVAKRAKAMGMKTIGVRARPAPTKDVDEVFGTDALSELWSRADATVISVPLLDSTRGLVSASAFAKMKGGSVFVDVSRGGVTNQDALEAALTSGHLRGGVVDVFKTEPLPKNSPLWALENLIITPHCSSVYDGWGMKSVAMFCENLTRYRNGEALKNVVDPTRGY
jgi:phosphoglycerate dehydrogenase-like enzyme